MIGFLKRIFSRCPARPCWTVPENPDYKEILSVLDEVLRYLSSPSCDVAWSRFSTPEEAIEKVTTLAARIREQDSSAISELRFLFLPTAALQEISLSSGWGDEYIELSTRFDMAIGEPM